MRAHLGTRTNRTGGTPSRKRDRAAEALVWAEYARTVRPLPGRALLPVIPEKAVPPVVAGSQSLDRGEPVVGRSAGMVRAGPIAVGAQPAGIDTGTWQRFRTNKTPAERTIDLHGRTAQRAFVALSAFLHAAHGDGVRCVEVVTGRGAGEAGGVIRRELPLWLNLPTLRPLILAAAHPHAQNPGSTRLLLRRVR